MWELLEEPWSIGWSGCSVWGISSPFTLSAYPLMGQQYCCNYYLAGADWNGLVFLLQPHFGFGAKVFTQPYRVGVWIYPGGHHFDWRDDRPSAGKDCGHLWNMDGLGNHFVRTYIERRNWSDSESPQNPLNKHHNMMERPADP